MKNGNTVNLDHYVTNLKQPHDRVMCVCLDSSAQQCLSIHKLTNGDCIGNWMTFSRTHCTVTIRHFVIYSCYQRLKEHLKEHSYATVNKVKAAVRMLFMEADLWILPQRNVKSSRFSMQTVMGVHWIIMALQGHFKHVRLMCESSTLLKLLPQSQNFSNHLHIKTI